MARKSLHQGVVIAVLLLNNLALLVLDGTKLREEVLKGSIHVDAALVTGILKVVVLDVGSHQLQSLLARNKEMLTIICQIINNKDTIIVIESLVVLKKSLHLSGIYRLQLLKTLVSISGAVLTALTALLIQALNITLKLADISGSGTGSLNKLLTSLESAEESTTAATDSSTTAAATGAGAGAASTATSASDFLEVLGALFLTRVLGISILYNGK